MHEIIHVLTWCIQACIVLQGMHVSVVATSLGLIKDGGPNAYGCPLGSYAILYF